LVTGDNPQTAKAIALECGILSSDEDAVEPNIIERRVFCNHSDAEREEIAGKISVRFVSVHLLLVLCFFVYLYTLKSQIS
jgi:magnesium-transporting ATPase (P-type)